MSSTGFPPINGDEYLKKDLIEAFEHSNNSSIKRHSAETLAYAFGDEADVQSLLADGYDPNSPTKVRTGVINGLRAIYLRSKFRPDLSKAVLSKKSIDVLAKAVADPSVGISMSSMDVVQYVKPANALQNLIERLQTATYPGHAEKIIEVLSLYDESQLLPYVDELDKTLFAVEGDQIKERIKSLVQTLKNHQ